MGGMFGVKDDRSFSNLGQAMFSMFRVLTADGWAAILQEITDGKGSLVFVIALVFFVSYITLCSLIVLQLFVAVVIVSFTDEVLGNAFAEYSDEGRWRRRERIAHENIIIIQALWKQRQHPLQLIHDKKLMLKELYNGGELTADEVEREMKRVRSAGKKKRLLRNCTSGRMLVDQWGRPIQLKMGDESTDLKLQDLDGTNGTSSEQQEKEQ